MGWVDETSGYIHHDLQFATMTVVLNWHNKLFVLHAIILQIAGSELHIWGLQYGHVLPGLPYQGTDERKEDQLTTELELYYILGFTYYG